MYIYIVIPKSVRIIYMSPLMPARLISAQNHGLPSGTQNIAGWKKSIMNIDMRRCTSQWKSVVDVQTEIRLFS